MQPKAKSNSIVTHTMDEKGVITFDVLGVGPLVFDRMKGSPENRLAAETNGWVQRIVDAAAISATEKDGTIRSKEVRAQLKFEAMSRVIEHYHSGSTEWNLKPGGGFGRSIVVEAIARVMKCDYPAAEAMIEKRAAAKYDGDKKKAIEKLRESKDVQAAIIAIQQERLPKPAVDADDELEALKAEGETE